MKSSFFKNMGSTLAICVAASLPGTASAEVTLSSKDGSVKIVGDIISYDGNEYELKTVFGVVIVPALSIDCEGEGCPETAQQDGVAGNLKIAGSPELLDQLLPTVLGNYAKSRGIEYLATDSAIELRSTTGDVLATIDKHYLKGDTSFSTLKSDGVDLVFQKDASAENSKSYDQEVIALDGIVVAVSSVNPLNTLSSKQIAQIFSGRITNWAQVGLPEGPVRAYAPKASSPVTAGFVDRILEPNGVRLDIRTFDDEAAVIEAIQNDPFAIGVLSYSRAEDVNIINVRGSCGLQVGANAFNIQTEEYPLTQRISAFGVRNNSNLIATDLFSFLQSNDAQEYGEGERLVGLGIQSQANSEQGLRHLAAMLPMDIDFNLEQQRELALAQLGAERLSTAFRFKTGSATLDERAKTDLNRLLEVLALNGVQNKEVILFGFTDAVGSGSQNRSLSQRRAEFVREQLLAADTGNVLGGTTVRALGYGELSPVACNQTSSDQGINRRVEVWLKDVVEQ